MLLTSVTPAAAYAPLRHSAFRMLWVATLASNTGLWIQNTGAGWLMTSLAPSPVMVSLVQAASMLPVFLFALPGGVLADILDRRLTLIAAQIWVVVAGLLLAGLAVMGWLGAWGLLALTFLIGTGTAVIFPAWAAAIPELVPRDDLVQAVALNGVGFNLARAFGPALGGVAMAAAGPGATFSLDALGFLALLWALLVWHRPASPHSDLPSERIPSAMRAALRFAIAMPIMRAAILRAWAFFFFASAVWGLLPLVVREGLGLGPVGFGLMLGTAGRRCCPRRVGVASASRTSLAGKAGACRLPCGLRSNGAARPWPALAACGLRSVALRSGLVGSGNDPGRGCADDRTSLGSRSGAWGLPAFLLRRAGDWLRFMGGSGEPAKRADGARALRWNRRPRGGGGAPVAAQRFRAHSREIVGEKAAHDPAAPAAGSSARAYNVAELRIRPGARGGPLPSGSC